MPDPAASNPFIAAQLATYGEIAGRLRDKIGQSPVQVVSTFSSLSPAHAKAAARRESLQLFLNAFTHLQSGGLFSTAVEKISLRSSPLAAGLGIKPPRYQGRPHAAPAGNGRDVALQYSVFLMDAATADLKKSSDMIYPALLHTDVLPAFGLPPQAALADPAAQAMKRQIVYSYETLKDAYKKACGDFRQELAEIPRMPAPVTPPPAR